MLAGLLSPDNPAFQSAVLPFLLAAVVAGLIRLAGGSGRGALLAGAAVAMAVLVVYVVVLGMPPLPPRSSGQKLFYVTAAGLALGVVLDLGRVRGRILALMLLAFVAAASVWVGWPAWKRLGAAPDTWMPAVTLLLLLIATVPLARAARNGISAAVMLLIAALGLAMVALTANAASLSQIAAALAAAVGGFLVWNWPKARFPVSAALLFGAMGAFASLTTQAALFTRADPWTLAPLPLAFLAAIPAARLSIGGGAVRAALSPIIIGFCAALPAALAVALGFWLNGDVYTG